MPDDHSANILTSGGVAVGGTAIGEIDTVGDRDWFAVELVAAQTYTIDLRGRPTGDGTLRDPYLRGIHDAVGNLISGTTNDDGGTGYNSQVTFTAAETGTHYIAAGAYSGRGTYELEVTDTAVPVEDSDATREGATNLGDITDLARPQFPRGGLDAAADAVHWYRLTSDKRHYLTSVFDRLFRVQGSTTGSGNGGTYELFANGKERFLKIPVFLIFLLICGSSFNESVHADTYVPVLISSLTENQYQAYRDFYHESLISVFELVGPGRMTLPLEEFGNLPLDIQTSVCVVTVDYSLFRSVITGAFRKSFGKEVMVFLLIKIVADIADIEWDFSTRLNPADKEKISKLGSSMTDDKGIKLDALIEKTGFCFENRLVERAAVPFHLVEKYSSVPIEFQLRDLYASSIPLIQWIRANIPPSEEKDKLETLVESVKRKYLLTF